MSVNKKLRAFFDAVRDEASRNPEFAARLDAVFNTEPQVKVARRPSAAGRLDVTSRGSAADTQVPLPMKRGNRRRPAMLDPIAEIDEGEGHLRSRLQTLDLEQLRDVVADFRMDPSKLVMKWKDAGKVIDHIVSVALSRGQKGDAFRRQ
jgi:hypothetical protein